MNKISLPRFAMQPLSVSAMVAAFVVAAPSFQASAASLSWTSTGDGILGGSGTWDTSSALWWNGASAQTWATNTTSGDTAVFAGTAGTVTLGANINALGLQFATPGYTITPGSNTLTVGASGIDASTLSSGTTTLGDTAISGIQSWTVGTGATLAVGAISRTAGSGSTLTLSSTGTFSTTTTDSLNGIIGGWAVIKTGASSYGFAHSGSSGTNNITAAATSALGTSFSGDNSTVNWINSDGNTTITAATQVNSFTSANDVTVSGLLTVGSGGVILGNNASKWFKNGTGGQLTTGLASGELFIHTANASSSDMRVWTPIVDNGSTPTILVKDGPGFLGLQPSTNNDAASASNTYTGGSILNGGTVALSGAQPLGTGAVQLNGATLTTFATGNGATAATVFNNIAVSGSAAFMVNTGGNLSLNGTLTGSGSLTFGNSTANNSVFLNLTNSLSSGTITMANSTNAVRFASANAGNANVAFVFNNTGANRDTLDFTTGTISFGSLSGAGSIQGNNAAGIKTISAGGLNTDTTFSGAIGGGAGVIALTKVGTGTLTLSGNNTYAGPTTIDAGTLAIGASERIANSSAMVLGGGTFATGGFSETLNTLTLSSSSTIDFGAGVSTVTFADSSSIAWTGTLTLLNFDVGTDFLNFTSSAGLTGTQLSDISLPGYTASGLDASGNVTFSAVPEPGAMALLVTGMGSMVLFARRRHRAA
jgi:fibronectin-binding autotransporter adhesin